MALYHLHAKILSRSHGRNALASAAYRSASRLHDSLRTRRHDFTKKTGVIHSQILLPTGASEVFLDRSTLWNEVERVEKRKDAQLAREVEFALPCELKPVQAIGLARDFVRQQFVSRGMIADLNVHWDIARNGQKKPHAHVMLTMRHVDHTGFGQKNRAWNAKSLLLFWRKAWADLANERLATFGIDRRIDHRSYAARCIPLEPQSKIGPVDGPLRASRRQHQIKAHQAIADRNGRRLLHNPRLARDILSREQQRVTRQDLARFVCRHTNGAEQFRQVFGVLEVTLGVPPTTSDAHRLVHVMDAYACAWVEAASYAAQGAPVPLRQADHLRHQGKALENLWPNARRTLDRAMGANPDLMDKMQQTQGTDRALILLRAIALQRQRDPFGVQQSLHPQHNHPEETDPDLPPPTPEGENSWRM
ncbi:MobQ family relaxase [Gluconobacter oxydans]|uniref:MobQ family relaxase n=1 Tax=Gluconobacter oxydans TaxID=442 RepID=UPI00062C2A54|nr:MobQ family relaxase [Gluconobacter oxydans]